MNTTTAPTVAETVAQVKREVLEDIGVARSSRGDVMPDTVGSFSELHEYVDANTYGGMCDEGFRDSFGPHYDGDGDPMTEDPWMVHCNQVQDEVDAWLKRGRVDEVPASDVAVGMLARPSAGPADLHWERPEFSRITSVTNDGGWMRVHFANGTGYEPRTTGTLEVKAEAPASVTLQVTPAMVRLLSDVLDFHDDDDELTEECDVTADTVAALRRVVADAIKGL